MKITIKKFLPAILTATLLVLVSCKPHEERVIDRLNNLSEKVEKNGSRWDADDWADALEELEDIHYDMEDCEFTPDQLRALGRVEGRLTVIIMTEGAKALGDQLTNFIEGAGAFMKGYQEGAVSAYDEETFENISRTVNEELEEISAELNDD